MFTGIIASTGQIASIRVAGGDWRLGIQSPDLDFSDVQLGDSIAVSGICLTVVELQAQGFFADASRETLACTTMGGWQQGEAVNLEKALLPTSRLGGHIVSGHVDGVGELVSRRSDARSERLVFRAPPALARYIAHKGSICIDGVSLTVNEVDGTEFGVNIIPHTAQRTTLHLFKPGRRVNLEVDVIARYLERLLTPGAAPYTGLTFEKLAAAGFGKNG